MSHTIPDIIQLHNDELHLELDRQGGNIRSVRYRDSAINPIGFQMRRGEDDQRFLAGHFVCTPRWGDASANEAAAGAIKHGDIMHQLWQVDAISATGVQMSAVSSTDQVCLERRLELSAQSALVRVQDRLTNLSNHFRPCNLVQHPTLAGEFLHAGTRFDCSGSEGYAYDPGNWEPMAAGNWPMIRANDGGMIDLRENQPASHGVYSFAVSHEKTAWISAYDPQSRFLLGYCWESHQYPWIHHWIHTENSMVRYRGMEFGTAGFHQSFRVYAERSNWQANGRPGSAFLDAKESRDFVFYFFLLELRNELTGISRVEIEHDRVRIQSAMGEEWNLQFA